MNIKQELLKAMSIIARAETDKLKFTKTIEAIVYDITEANIGKYKVKYQDSIFYAYSNDVKLQYKINDIVLVLIPDGDFSQQKTIIGKKGAAANEDDMASTQDILDKIDLIGPDWSSENLGNYYDLIKNPLGLIAGGETDSIVLFNGFSSFDTPQAKLFSNYLKQCHSFLIKADFKTLFPQDRIQEYYGGNYGIKVVLSQNEEKYEYILDLSNMTGDPYNYSVNSPQYIVFKYDNEALKDAFVTEISVFQKDFNLVPQEFEDIIISNIQISFAEEIDEIESGYSVYVKMPQGNMISSNDITLVPNLKLDGVITNFSSVKWFIRDLSVSVNSEYYNSNAGLGWKEITEGINEDTLILNSQSGIGKTIYANTELKVIIFKESNIFSKIVEVFPLTSLYNFSLDVSYNNKSVTLQIEPQEELQASYIYYWGKIDESQINYFLGEGTSSYTFNINEVYLNNTFYCSVFNKNRELLSTVKTVISKELTADNFSIIFTGNHFYSYDANGDIDINVANAEHKIGFELYSPEGEKIEVAENEWIFPNTEFSMISPIVEDLTVNEVRYKIAPKYNINKLNNTLILKITTYEGQKLEFRKEIVCLKAGNSGTNGTKYTAALTFKDVNSSYVKKGDSNQTAIINLSVYEDGTLLPQDEYSVVWSVVGKDRDKKLISLLSSNSSTANYVFNAVENNVSDSDALTGSAMIKAVVSVGNYKINAFKVIPVLLEGEYDNSIDWIDFVEYSPSGELPSYNKNAYIPKEWKVIEYNKTASEANPIYFKENKIKVFDENNNSTNADLDEFQYDKNYSLIPVDSYDNSGKNASVILQKESIKILWPVAFWLNTYGNESVNTWDGISVEISEDNGYILSPLVGAGEKNSSTNTFTGVLMGTIGYYNGSSFEKNTGLFGFSEGIQTFSVDAETGNVVLGAKDNETGGQILIDAERAILQSGGFNGTLIDSYYATKGTQIDLLNGSITSMNFAIDDNGDAHFRGSGEFQGKITAQSGEIGAWSITENGDLQATVEGGSIWLSASTGSIYGSKKGAESNSWSITPEGITTSYLNATGGFIGGWAINEDSLSAGQTYLKSDGTASFGNLQIYYATDTSGSTDGYIGPISEEWGMSIDNDGLCFWTGYGAGYNFIVQNDGSLRAGGDYIEGRANDQTGWLSVNPNGNIYLGMAKFDSTGTLYKYENGNWKEYSGGSGDGNVTYDVGSFTWGFSDGGSVTVSNINNSSAISWNKMLYFSTTDGEITGVSYANMHYERGLLNNTSSEEGNDALPKLKELLGTSSSGSGGVVTDGNGHWWYKPANSKPDGYTVLTTNGKTIGDYTYLGISDSKIQLWNLGFTNGLVTSSSTQNTDYTKDFAGIIAGYL